MATGASVPSRIRDLGLFAAVLNELGLEEFYVNPAEFEGLVAGAHRYCKLYSRAFFDGLSFCNLVGPFTDPILHHFWWVEEGTLEGRSNHSSECKIVSLVFPWRQVVDSLQR